MITKTLTRPDGYTLHYRVWPAAAGPRGVIVLLHGVMSHSQWLTPLAEPLAALGFQVIGADRRGSGLNPEARGDALSAQAIVDDALAIVDAETLPDTPTHLVGWCWGAIVAVHLAQKRPFRRVVLLAPGIFPTEVLKTRMAVQEDRIKNAPEDAAILVSPIDERMFTDGPALEGFILRDPLRLERFTPRFHGITARLTMMAAALLSRLGKNTLVLLAEHDEATDNETTIRALGKAAVPWKTIPGTKHGMQFDAPAAVVSELTQFLDPVEV